MPFLRSSTRPQPVQCFFCLSPSLLPPRPHVSPPVSPGRKGKERIAEPGTKWNWQCERCGCWNIRDAVRIAIPKDPRRWLSDFLTNWPQTGEMMSDLPAMHNSAFNSKSFALRGELQMLSHMLPVCSADISPGMTSPTFVKPFTDRIIINFAILSELPDEPNVDHEHVGQLPAR